jgi:hypothetical protein
MTAKQKNRTKREVIMEVWAESDSQSAGAYELNLIQQAVEDSFGTDESPANLARILADGGIPLRHPEILEADSAWREQSLSKLFGATGLDFGSLKAALESVSRIEELRLQLVEAGDQKNLKSLVEHVREVKTDLLDQQTLIGREAAEWLTVWLQNPSILENWLSLRQDSADFLKKFGS